MGATPSTHDDAPTRQMVAAAGVSDRCTNCGAPLASDQRYCVNCGERRGKSRFSFASMAAPAAVETSTVQEVQRRPRMSSGSTLVAFIATLLVAVGLGVLIGRENANTRTTAASAPPVQVVTLGGGGGTAASTGNTGTGNSSGNNGSTSNTSSKKVPSKKVVITKVVAAKATAAASKVLGGATNLAPPTVQQGGACSNGQAGCQNGQFTGNFFGGG
jgi:uncharacterized OB-fold protein